MHGLLILGCVLGALAGGETPGPAQPCSEHSDCPVPYDACWAPDCWDGYCMEVAVFDCDDGDPCTTDACVDIGEATCTNTPIPDCCMHADECPEAPTCHQSYCRTTDEVMHVGECTVEPLDDCCIDDDNCTVTYDWCQVSTCNTTTNLCNVPEARDCAVNVTINLCTEIRCNSLAEQCEYPELPEAECLGACCYDDTCEELDRSWCAMHPDSTFGINIPCDEFQCPTPMPTNSPTPSPTNSPTSNPTLAPTGRPTPSPTPDPPCETDSDCPTPDKCHTVECEHGMCMEVPNQCNDNDPCTVDECDPDTGICVSEKHDPLCCVDVDEDCVNDGDECTFAVCTPNPYVPYTGLCEVLAKDNCCTQSSECDVAGDLCIERACRDNECVDLYERECGEDHDNDLCTVIQCDPDDGMCKHANLTGDDCLGACCIDGQCEELDELWCDMRHGSFIGDGIPCDKENILCHTPAPTHAPTSVPTDAPTEPPTPRPTPSPTVGPDCECNDDCDFHKCFTDECVENECVYTPKNCTHDDPCTLSVCNEWNDQCEIVEDHGCCETPSDCFDAGPCVEPTCVPRNDSSGLGDCGEHVIADCCLNNDMCLTPGNLCVERICNNDYLCETVGPVFCKPDLDYDPCTIRQCNNDTGDCGTILLPDHDCPGACCVEEECEQLSPLECSARWGVFIGHNQTCSKAQCITAEPTPRPTPTPTRVTPTAAPTRVVPTDTPTRPTPTAEPTRVVPTPTAEYTPAPEPPTLRPTPPNTPAPRTPAPESSDSVALQLERECETTWDCQVTLVAPENVSALCVYTSCDTVNNVCVDSIKSNCPHEWVDDEEDTVVISKEEQIDQLVEDYFHGV